MSVAGNGFTTAVPFERGGITIAGDGSTVLKGFDQRDSDIDVTVGNLDAYASEISSLVNRLYARLARVLTEDNRVESESPRPAIQRASALAQRLSDIGDAFACSTRDLNALLDRIDL